MTNKLRRVQKKEETTKIPSNDGDDLEFKQVSPRARGMGDAMDLAQAGDEFASTIAAVKDSLREDEIAEELTDEELQEELENMVGEHFMTLADKAMELAGMEGGVEGNLDEMSEQDIRKQLRSQDKDGQSSKELREKLANQS